MLVLASGRSIGSGPNPRHVPGRQDVSLSEVLVALSDLGLLGRLHIAADLDLHPAAALGKRGPREKGCGSAEAEEGSEPEHGAGGAQGPCEGTRATSSHSITMFLARTAQSPSANSACQLGACLESLSSAEACSLMPSGAGPVQRRDDGVERLAGACTVSQEDCSQDSWTKGLWARQLAIAVAASYYGHVIGPIGCGVLLALR